MNSNSQEAKPATSPETTRGDDVTDAKGLSDAGANTVGRAFVVKATVTQCFRIVGRLKCARAWRGLIVLERLAEGTRQHVTKSTDAATDRK